jgi:hypothetical protein
MPKKPKTKLPFKAKTMGSAQRGIALARGRRDARTAAANTSSVTVIRPDENGNLVEVETVAPVPSPTTPKPKRPKIPKADRSLL